MILINHELKQGWKSLAVWTSSIGFFIIICVFLYPEMNNLWPALLRIAFQTENAEEKTRDK